MQEHAGHNGWQDVQEEATDTTYGKATSAGNGKPRNGKLGNGKLGNGKMGVGHLDVGVLSD